MLKHSHATPINLELIARYFFSCYFFNEWVEWHEQTQMHLVFVGFGSLVPALIRQAILLSPYKDFKPLAITLISPHARQDKQSLLKHLPILAKREPPEAVVIDHLNAIDCTEDYTLNAAQLRLISQNTLPCAVIFAADQGLANLQHALTLRHISQTAHCWRIPFYVYTLSPVSSFTSYLPAMSKQPQEQIIAFGHTIDPLVLADLESNAAYIHESYRQHQLRHQPNPLGSSSNQPWDALPETYRLANRRAGDHLPIKLASLGCYVQPCKRLVLDTSINLNGNSGYMLPLARLEHRSWRYERLLDGWRYAPQRNDQQRLHPSLVLWHDPRLSEAEKAKDLEQIEYVRLTLLQQAGQEPITVRYQTTIGLIGHNFLTSEQVSRVLKQLHSRVLPAIAQQYAHHFLTLFTPLAPGSDFILAKAMTDWLSLHAIPHRLVVIQSIGLEAVVAAYKKAWQQGGSWDGSEHGLCTVNAWEQAQALILQGLRNFIQRTPTCHSILDLRPEGQDAFALPALAFQYAARWLVKHSQHMIVVYDASRNGGVGGTAETLQEWQAKDSQATHLHLLHP